MLTPFVTTAARIRSFFDTVTFTATHVVSCLVTRAAAVIYSVLDFDIKFGRTSSDPVERVLAHGRANDLDVHWHIETHAHADHFSDGEKYGNLLPFT